MSVYTFGQFKTAIRQIVFPTGEADNLVASHNKMFVDALKELQTWDECLRQDHTDIIPQCATLYQCGLTVINPAPRGFIYRVTVVDKLDPTTLLESATGTTDYCRPIEYTQVDPRWIEDYLSRSHLLGYCLSIPWFFSLPFCGCAADLYPPVPTDEGVPAGLPVLPLGAHYPQTSTDKTLGRSFHGRWAIHHGRIYIAPWIQSTETVLIEWDGIKDTWNDGDAIDPDPLLSEAVEEYIRWKHADKWDRDFAEAQRAQGAYLAAKQLLIHNCREETRVRYRETSQSRASVLGLTTLYYNTDQSATATCPDGTTGDAKTVTIAAGTVASTVSVADANEKAKQQAQVQANSMLVCTPTVTTFTNDTPGDYTATCAGASVNPDAPDPTGTSVHVRIEVGRVTSTVSVAAANASAQAQAETEAKAQLVCTFYNAAAAATATCQSNPGVTPTTGSVVAGKYTASGKPYDPDGNANSLQNTVDQQAQSDAQNQANDAMAPLCVGDAPSGLATYNTIQTVDVYANGRYYAGPHTILSGALITLHGIMPPALFSATGADAQNRANRLAQQALLNWVQPIVNALGLAIQPNSNPTYQITYPTLPPLLLR